MGSTLIVGCFEWPETTGGAPALPGPGLVAEMRRRWAAVPPAVRVEIADWWFGEVGPDEVAGVGQVIDESIGLFFEDAHRWPRDVTRLDQVFGDHALFVSGGMSGGDDPSESYRAVLGIALSHITEDPVDLAGWDRLPGTTTADRDGTRWVVEYHEGGVVQAEAADGGVTVVRFDFDEIVEGDGSPEYIEERLAALMAVPEGSRAHGLARQMVEEIITKVRARGDQEGLLGVVDRFDRPGADLGTEKGI